MTSKRCLMFLRRWANGERPAKHVFLLAPGCWVILHDGSYHVWEAGRAAAGLAWRGRLSAV